MNFFEIVLTLAISLGAVVWGVNIYNQKGHLVSCRMEYNE